jgi:hypothetical protein
MSFTEVIQLRVQGRKLHCGSLKLPFTGRVAYTRGSMNKCLLDFEVQHPRIVITLLFDKLVMKFWLELVSLDC